MKRFKELMEEWDELTSNLSTYGAADTEPTVVLEYILEKYIIHGKNLLPQDATQWQLYSYSMDCDDAAAQLNAHAQKMIDLIDSMKYCEVREIAEYYDF